jgi:hypothetical protein
MRSYTSSTDGDRPSGGQHILGGVHVSVMAGATPLAYPRADRQRQPVGQVTARRAGLARWQPTVDDDQIAPIPGALVLQHPAQLAPGRVADRPGKRVVGGHASHVQVLDHDRLVFADESSRQLVQMIAASVGDAGVDAGNPQTGPATVVGPLLSAGQDPLRLGESLEVPEPVAWVRDLLPCRQRHQRGQPGVNADLRLGWRQRMDGRVLDPQRDVPAASRVAADGHGAWLATFGQRAGPADVEWPGQPDQGELPVLEAEGRARVLGGVTLPSLGLEPRIASTTCPEGHEGALEVPQALLKRNRGHLVQERQLLSPLPGGEHRRGLRVGEPSLFGVPGSRPDVQRPVVDHAHAPERAAQHGRLLGRRVEAVTIGALDHGRTLVPACHSGASVRCWCGWQEPR